MSDRLAEIRGEITSADASVTAAAAILYDANGAVVALGATERLVISDIHVNAAAAMTLDLFVGAGNTPAAGERVATFTSTASNSSLVSNCNFGLLFKKGQNAKVKTTAAGAIVIVFSGFIARA